MNDGSDNQATLREMPRYKCHKQVHALKILHVHIESDERGLVTPVDDGFAPFFVSSEFMEKHNPEGGGYYVVYKDGYKSFSPAKAFDEGYSLI